MPNDGDMREIKIEELWALRDRWYSFDGFFIWLV